MDRFWVGGAGTWNTTSTTNWSATSGGGSGASVPTVADNVFFDQAGTYTVTMTGALTCLDITVSAGTVTFATGTGPSLNIRGSMTLLAGTVWTSDAAITFSSTTTGRTVTTNGVSFPNSSGLNFSGAGGGWTLGSAISATNAIVNFTQGTLDTSSSGNYSITVFRFSITGALTRTLNLNSSTVTVISGAGNTVEISGSNLTFNAGTSQINIPGANPSFYGPGYTFYNVAFTSTSAGTRSITDPFSTRLNTAYNNLSVTGPASVGVVTLSLAGPQTINGTLSTTGTAGNRRVFFTTATYGISQDLVVNSAPSLTDADFRGLYVRGTAAPISGTRIGNRGECRGITFSAPKTVYWNLAGAQNWNADAWATTSTGTPSTDNFPLPQDTATFTNAGSVTGTISVGTSTLYLPTVDMSTRTTSMVFSINGTAVVYGNWTNGSGVTISVGTATLTFSGGTTQTITSAGKAFISPITVDTYGGTVQLADALNIGSNPLTVTNGTFNTAGYAVNASSLSSSNSNIRTINFGASTVSLSTSGSAFNLTTSTNLTFNAGTSTIRFSSTAITFQGGSQTFYDVSFTNNNSSTHEIFGTNTFNNLAYTAPASAGLMGCTFSANQTINGTLTCAGASAVRRIFLLSSVVGTPRTLTVNAISATDCDFRDITLAGAASGASPTRAGNCGGNTGITFPAPKTVYWNLAGAQNWSATGWCPSSGGTPDINQFPLAQDTAVFDNTGSVTGFIQIQANWNIGTFDASLRTSAMTLTSPLSPFVYGDWKFGTGVTSSINGGAITFSKNGTQTITSNGVQFQAFLTINHPLANVQLADALSLGSTRTLTLAAGMFDAVTYNVTTGLLTNNSTANTLKMGTGTWTLSGTSTVWSCVTQPTLIAGTSTIVLSDTSTSARAFAGGGLYYNKLTIGGTTGTSTLTISGSNTFGELASTKTVAHTIIFASTLTHTIGKWAVTGTVGNVVTISPGVTASAYTISIAGPANSGIDYLSVRDCLVSPTSPGEFYVGANSTNVSGNTRVIFTAAPTPRTLYWVGGTGNWSDTARWSTSSGGSSGAAVPMSLDSVTFDSLSNATAYTATIDTQVRCAAFTMAGPLVGNVTWAGTSPMYFHGNVSFAATGITRTYTGVMNWAGNGSYTFTTNGLGFQSSVTVIGIGATWTLGSALNIGPNQLTVTYGTFDTSVSNYNFNFSTFSSGNQNIRSVVFNASTITAASISASPATNLTFNAGTSQINFTSSTPFISGGLTFYNLSFTGGSVTTVNIADTNTFNTLSFAGRTSVGINAVTFSANQTIGTLTLSAGTASAYRTFLASNTIGTQRTLNVTTLTAGAADIDFRDIAITGAAAPLTGTRFGDAKGNSGITFPAAKTVYWRSTNTQNWGSASAGFWSATSGGAADATQFPLAQDTAVVPAAYPNSGNSISINADYNIGTLDMNERNGSALLTLSSSATSFIHGNWTNGTGTTLTGLGVVTFAGRGTQTITSAGKTFTQSVVINSPGGSVTLQDAFSSSRSTSGAFTVTQGTFDANIYNVSVTGANGTFSTSSTLVRTVAIGSGTWTLSGSGTAWDAVTATNLTVTGTGTISLTSASAKTFVGGTGISYSGITLNQGGAGALSMFSSNTLKTITNSYSATGATSINFSNQTQTLTSPWTATGEVGRVLTISGTSAASPATLVFTGAGAAADVDYLAINNVRAYDLVDEWYAGPNSTNGGSLGWYFIAKPSGNVYAVTITETGTGTDAITAKVTLLGTISETGTGTDSISSSFLYLRAVSESATVTDSNFAAFQPKANITETATGSDVESAILSAISLIAETATGSDTDLARLVAGATLTETATGTDTDAAALTVRPTITETATGSDTEAARYITRPSISETATGTDAENALYIARPTISETATGSDDDSAKLTVRPNISETGTITDADVGRISFPTTITETATGSDAEATRYIARPVISETATGSDADVAILTVRPAIIEAATGSDSDSAILTARPSISETATGTDTDSARLNANSNINETATVTDAASAFATLLAAVSEAATATDLTDSIKGLFAYIVESASITDALNAPGSTYNPRLTETATATDNIVALARFAVQVVESASITDIAAAFKAYLAEILEAASSSDAVSASFTARSVITETATGADTDAAIFTAQSVISEAATGTETVSSLRTLRPSIAEAAAGADSASTRNTTRPDISEAATGTDAPTTTAEFQSQVTETSIAQDIVRGFMVIAVQVLESSTGSDQISALRALAAAVVEAVSGSDAVSAKAVFQGILQEIANLTDSVNAPGSTYSAPVVELATLQDAVRAAATFPTAVTETATGTETVQATFIPYAQITETATITDAASALAIFAARTVESAYITDQVSPPGSIYNPVVLAVAQMLDQVSPPGSIYNAPVLESATISDSLIGGFLWIDVNDDQVANWGDINNVQTTTWLAVDDSQTTNWQNVNNTQTSGWTDVDDTQTPGWNPVLP